MHLLIQAVCLAATAHAGDHAAKRQDNASYLLLLDGVAHAPDILNETRVLRVVADLLAQINSHKTRFLV